MGLLSLLAGGFKGNSDDEDTGSPGLFGRLGQSKAPGETPFGAVSATPDAPARGIDHLKDLDASHPHTYNNPASMRNNDNMFAANDTGTATDAGSGSYTPDMGKIASLSGKRGKLKLFEGGEPDPMNPSNRDAESTGDAPVPSASGADVSKPNATKKGGFSNIIDTLKSTFARGGITYGPDGSTDGTGIPMPTQNKEGIGHKIMRYALPAVMGLTGGIGIAPGIMSAMASENNKDKDFTKAMEDYMYRKQGMTSLNQTGRIADKKVGLDTDKAKETVRHNKAMENRPVPGAASLGALSDKRRAMDIAQKYQADPKSVSKEDVNFYKSYMRLSGSTKPKYNSLPTTTIDDGEGE